MFSCDGADVNGHDYRHVVYSHNGWKRLRLYTQHCPAICLIKEKKKKPNDTTDSFSFSLLFCCHHLSYTPVDWLFVCNSYHAQFVMFFQVGLSLMHTHESIWHLIKLFPYCYRWNAFMQYQLSSPNMYYCSSFLQHAQRSHPSIICRVCPAVSCQSFVSEHPPEKEGSGQESCSLRLQINSTGYPQYKGAAVWYRVILESLSSTLDPV